MQRLLYFASAAMSEPSCRACRGRTLCANCRTLASIRQLRCPGYNMLPDHGCGQRLILGNMLCDDCLDAMRHDEYKEEFAKRHEQKNA